ncbi:MAG: SpoIID/LytB domain-containing protein [Thermoleophilaceae bacterium]
MRRSLLITALALALLAPAAGAATRHIVHGRGFGHGIGMSQYGAYGYAQHGVGYARILAHYYRHTHLGTLGSRRVRVLLQSADPFIRVRGASRAGGRHLRPGTTYKVRRSRGRLSLRSSSGRLVGRFSSPLKLYRPGHVVRLLGPALNGVRSGRYRGAIEVRSGGRGVTAINALPIDPYVQGVVPGEMPSSWDIEALKAQAVAARSYAMATDKPGAFDQYPDTRSQVYRGVAAETGRTNSAVRATSRQILTYAGLPAVTYYHSTSGGHTENVELSFLGALPQPYLRGVRDPYDGISPHHRWRRSFSTRQMTARLHGYVRGRFRKIRVLRRGVSPRIVRARVYGTRGTRRITGATLRLRLGLMDSWARFTRVSTSQAGAGPARAAVLTPPLRAAGGVFGRARRLSLVGVFDPAPSGRRLVVERRRGGHWRRVRAVRTSRGGRYRATIRVRGLYRVRAGGVAGPAVRVR